MTLSGNGGARTNTAGDGGNGEAAPVSVQTLSLRLILCLAGDGEPEPAELEALDELKEREGDNLYAESLRMLVGRRAVPEFAEQEWNTLLSHRSDMEQCLGRPVSLQTAALDFFCEARPAHPEMVLVPAEVFHSLRQDARIDTTTGLFTPSSFAWALDHEVRRARRYHRNIVLILVDIDDMEALSGRRGTEYSDFVLREVADLVNQNIRNTDTAARVDADTFAVLLHECKLGDGRNLAERLRCAIERQTFSLFEGDEGAHLTASLAVVGYPESGESGDKLMTKARSLLGLAREHGKNCVEAAEMPF